MREIDKTLVVKIKENKAYLFSLVIYSFLFLFFCSKMSPLYPSNEWVDVNIYFNMGKAMFNGRTLYTEVFDQKGPLIFIIYGFGYLISNSTYLGLYIILGMGWSMALSAVYLTAMSILEGNKTFSLVTALCVPVFALTYMHTGGSPEEFSVIFHLICLYIFVDYYNSDTKTYQKPMSMLTLGIMSAMIFFMKLNLTVFCIFGLLGILINYIRHSRFKDLLSSIGYYAIGILIVSLPICIYLFANDALLEAYNIYIILNRDSSIIGTPYESVYEGVKRVWWMFRDNTISATLLLAGSVLFPVLCIKDKIGKVMFIAGAISMYAIILFAGTCHFYYPLALYMLLPLGLMVLFKYISKYIKLKDSIPLAWGMIAIALLCANFRTQFFYLESDVLTRKKEPQGSSYYFAKIIAKENNPTLLNMAFGDPNNVFTLANIVPNIKYFTSTNIDFGVYPQLRNGQMASIENGDTQFVIVDDINQTLIDWEPLNENYTLEATYEGLELYQNVPFPRTVLLFKRKD